jgi:cell division protein FtsW (lipid II flippase)
VITRLAGGILAVALGVVGLVDGYLALGRYSFRQDVLPPGWYLVAMSGLLVVCGVTYLAWQWRAVGPADSRVKVGMPLKVWGSLVLYVVLTPVFGYTLATMVFFAVMLFLLGVRPPLRVGLLALVFTAVFYIVFVVVANIILPQGWLLRLFI